MSTELSHSAGPVNGIRLLDREVMIDPYPVYALLRAHAPVHWDADLNGWIVTRYDDVSAALRDYETFSSGRISLLAARGGAAPSASLRNFIRLAEQWMWMLDPPEHTRVRKLMNRGFSPRDVRNLRPLIQEIVGRLVDDLLKQDAFDLMKGFCYAVPALVIAALYDLPKEDGPLLTGWCDVLKVFLGGTADLAASGEPAAEALRQMSVYLTEVIADRRRAPRDDLVSRLVHAEEDGDRLGEEELCSNLLLLVLANFETTVDMLGNGLLGLLRQRDQWELIKSDPRLIPAAVDEILRWDGPVQLTHRLATRDAELHGKRIGRGQLVYLVRAAANRDPARFTDPDRIDVTRSGTGHLSLGAGIHYCVGGGLAKLEGAVALSELTRRIPGLALIDGRPPRWRADNLQFRGLDTLPATAGSG